MYRKILVPLDGSELAEYALPHVKPVNVRQVLTSWRAWRSPINPYEAQPILACLRKNGRRIGKGSKRRSQPRINILTGLQAGSQPKDKA